MAVYDTMRFIDCDVATYSFGMAASMGQFLLTAGTPGKRFSLPHTRIMMHQPSAGVGGTQSDITIQADMLRRLERDIDQLQAEHSGQSVEQVERDADRDRWSTPNRPASTASSTTSSPRPGRCRARPGGRPVTRPDDAPAQDRRPAALGRRPLG